MFAGLGLVTDILGESKRNAVLCASHLVSSGMFCGGVSLRHSIEGHGTPHTSSVASWPFLTVNLRNTPNVLRT